MLTDSIKGKKFFRIKQQKTGKVVNCLITSDIQKMMKNRYGGGLPKKMLAQHINKHLKVIGKKAKINQSVIMTSTVGGKKETVVLPQA